jgi:hypothetical protein
VVSARITAFWIVRSNAGICDTSAGCRAATNREMSSFVQEGMPRWS